MDHCYFHGIKSHPNGVYRHVSYNIWEPADGKHPLWSLDICVLLQNRGPAILHPRWSTDDSSCCWPLLPVEQQNGYQNHTQAAWQLPVWKPTLEARTLFGDFLYFQVASGGQATPCWDGMSRKGWDEIMRQLMHLLTIEGNTKQLNVILKECRSRHEHQNATMWRLGGSECPSPKKREKPDVNGKCLWRCLEDAAM